jgi:hypothetical protein
MAGSTRLWADRADRKPRFLAGISTPILIGSAGREHVVAPPRIAAPPAIFPIARWSSCPNRSTSRFSNATRSAISGSTGSTVLSASGWTSPAVISRDCARSSNR